MNGEIQFVAKALEQVDIATALVTEGEGGAHAETVHAAKIADQLQSAVPLVDARTLEAATAEAYRRAKPGDTVLLAPACASFDAFENFERRGERFRAIVAGLR